MYIYTYVYISVLQYIPEMSQRDDLRLKKTEIIIKILDLENMIINEKNEKMQTEILDYNKRKSFLSKMEELKKVSEVNLLQKGIYMYI
jgi:DNA-binding protein H-NS